MKKSKLIFSAVIIALSLAALGLFAWSNSDSTQCATANDNPVALAKAVISGQSIKSAPELFYNIDSRYGTSISKEKLHKAKSVRDILPKEADWSKYPVHTLHVTLLQDYKETTETGDNLVLNKAQAELLRSMDYSESFHLKANCNGKHKDVPDREVYDLNYFITVTPENEAEYIGGEDALIDYLKKNSSKETAMVKEDQLESGGVIFTVTKDGTVVNVKLSSTSGYSSIDKAMVELITNLPGTWDPATNAEGEKLDQEFVFSFGRGC